MSKSIQRIRTEKIVLDVVIKWNAYDPTIKDEGSDYLERLISSAVDDIEEEIKTWM